MATDILHLVDRLEALVEKARRLPLTSAVLVDEGAFLDIIDQMRISIPEEVKQAKRLQQEREQVIAEAQEEGARIIAKAREDAARLVADHELRRQAQARAERIIEEAQRQAQGVAQGADDYALDVLSRLSEELAGLSKTIANGLAILEERRAQSKGQQSGRRRAVGAPPAPGIEEVEAL